MRHQVFVVFLFILTVCPRAQAQQSEVKQVKAAVYEMYDSSHSYDYAVLRNTLTDDFEMLIFGRRLDADGFEQILRGMEEQGVEFSETELLDFNTEIADEDVAYTTWRTTNWLDGAIIRQALDGLDVAPGAAMRQGDAGQPRRAVDQHRAGAAFAAVAAHLGAGQADLFAQVIDQQRVVGHRVLARLSVHGEAEDGFHDAMPLGTGSRTRQF